MSILNRPLRIAIVSYPTFGGSGVVASELGHFLSERGHEVHFISYNKPVRLRKLDERVHFHPVQVVSYPLFEFPPYTLTLTTKIFQVVKEHAVDIIHCHYAIPHSTAAYLAQQMLGRHQARVITTLHGTDVELVGLDPSYRDVVNFSLRQSDGLTAVSHFLKRRTEEDFQCGCTVRVIHNFVDTTVFKPGRNEAVMQELNPCRSPLIVHASNFREVKNIPEIIEIFARVYQRTPCRLLLVGNGPFLPVAQRMVEEHGLREVVTFKEFVTNIQDVLGIADLFLLASHTESFGLSALEAMACGVPVAAYAVGGIPEVVVDNECGLLEPPGQREQLALRIAALLRDRSQWQRMSEAARERAVTSFDPMTITAQYESLYYQLVEAASLSMANTEE